MKPEEHAAILNEIATNLTDGAKVTSLLSQLREDYSGVLTESTTAQETATRLTEANKKLQEYNMELFLNRGVKTETKSTETKDEDKKQTYSDLDLSNY